VVHGEAQLAGRWGEHGRQIVLDTSSVKVFLPGITDVTTLQAAESWPGRGHTTGARSKARRTSTRLPALALSRRTRRASA
jgi:hypothetical protein